MARGGKEGSAELKDTHLLAPTFCESFVEHFCYARNIS